MCGIAGVMMRGGRVPAPAALARMAQALRHRGPDGEGIRTHGDVGLVHTRLSIVDIAGGAQPLMAGDVALIANGEVYNDPQLRSELPGPFATGSDCESALHLYLRSGEAFAEKLRGMYAVAIHDPGKAQLLLARDPFGIKPLYYAETEDGFYFASEPQALIAAGVVTASVDETPRDEVLAFNFSVGVETPFSRIARVAPGETLVIADGRIIRRHSRTALPAGIDVARSDTDAVKAFDAVWQDSVQAHQRSDVPFGMFLSGGIDSTAVLAMMARLNTQSVLAFTAAFPDTNVHDERDAARAAAKAASARHVEIEITAADFWRDLPAIAEAVDDPVCDYAVVPTYVLARAAARDVKVVLTGEGGDELFAGYGRMRAALRPWPFNKTPWRRDMLRGLRQPSTAWTAGMEEARRRAAARHGDELRALQALDCAAWLPNDLLTKLDRWLMAHGVEGRVPFLDAAVADFAFSLLRAQKIRGRRGKWVVRQWLAEHFPAADAFAKKRGFTVPVGAWIAQEAARLGPLVAHQSGVAEVCAPEAVHGLFGGITEDNAGQAWSLLFYALWHRRHIIGDKTDGDVFEVLARA